MLKSLIMAFSCFSHLPMPQVEWESDNMRFILAWLPAVGLVLGLLVAAWCLICDAVGFGAVLKAGGIALIPLAVTGGFHLDGFADVIDAQASHAEPTRKREILKDSHIGAFAAIGVAAYVVAYFALATELPAGWRVAVLLLCLHVLSRCGSGFASSMFWGNGTGGMLTSFRDSADVRLTVAIVICFFLVAGIAAIVIAPLAGCLMVVTVIALLAWINWFAQRNFGGMSGDVAGFFLQVCEILLLACIVIAAKAVGL
ncbi:MAG: adenosylcobinamide-GDP ribazoletransferase [Eggerthellaceae bacterium]|nr:adenosylcobinamide-GDP ribazoletransferase [Eggerthellaceae bacterium]